MNKTLPKKLKIKKTDSKEIRELKETLNQLLEFHYQFHSQEADKGSGMGGGC